MPRVLLSSFKFQQRGTDQLFEAVVVALVLIEIKLKPVVVRCEHLVWRLGSL